MNYLFRVWWGHLSTAESGSAPASLARGSCYEAERAKIPLYSSDFVVKLSFGTCGVPSKVISASSRLDKGELRGGKGVCATKETPVRELSSSSFNAAEYVDGNISGAPAKIMGRGKFSNGQKKSLLILGSSWV